ncbi:MAG TPA: hypothetical protein VN047_18430 [Sphingopyxis sp.]|uniref:hypothetical protein n=1 Tax=Sphingopyxis sp. TaxID=1908224 RepID=UPI002C6EE6BE|nr:hypothetical protein [Sphingopyxis sp.]HWW58876.1 hypothetical protein [Sphingopyxis sp.]
MSKPYSIKLFDRLFLGAIVLGLFSFALPWKESVDLLANNPQVSAAGLGSGFLIASFAIGIGFNLLIWFFISRRASKVAKWIQAIFFGLGLLFFLANLNNPLAPHGLALVLNLVIYALYGGATFMLFRPDAVTWFNADRVNPDTFR